MEASTGADEVMAVTVAEEEVEVRVEEGEGEGEGEEQQEEQQEEVAMGTDAGDVGPDVRASLCGGERMHEKLRASIEQTGCVTIFFSSPFGGMEDERSAFVERYLPALRTLCENKGVTLALVDLRWGITEEQAAKYQTLTICLNEIDRSDIFIGCYGNRYGTRHDENLKATHWVGTTVDMALPQYPWLDDHRLKGITELEYRHGFLNDPDARPAMFFFRDKKYDDRMIAKYADDPRKLRRYINQDENSERLRRQLEKEIRVLASERSDLNITATNYEEPEDAAQQMFDVLKNTLEKVLPEASLEGKTVDSHSSFAAVRRRFYIGNDKLITAMDAHATHAQNLGSSAENYPMVVLGESGSGKSALLSNWIHHHQQSHPNDLIFAHFTGCDSASTSLRNLLMRLTVWCNPGDAENIGVTPTQQLCEALPHVLHARAEALRSKEDARLILVLDALNQLENETLSWLPNRAVHKLDWLPITFHEKITVICSTLPGQCKDTLLAREYPTISTYPLAEEDSRTFIDTFLKRASKTLTDDQRSIILTAKQCGNPLFLTLMLEELIAFGVYEQLSDKVRELADCTSVPALLDAILTRLEASFSHIKGRNRVATIFQLIGVSRQGVMEEELKRACGVKDEEGANAYDFDILFGEEESPGTSSPDKQREEESDGESDGEKEQDEATMSAFAWSCLSQAVRHLLVNKRGRFNFLHDYIRQTVLARFLSLEEEVASSHHLLASIFMAQPLYLTASVDSPATSTAERGSENKNKDAAVATRYEIGNTSSGRAASPLESLLNVRKVTQLPFHLAHSQQHEQGIQLLCDLEFVDAKCMLGEIFDLLQDFNAFDNVLHQANVPAATKQVFEHLSHILAFNLPILSRQPDSFLPVAVNEPRHHAVTKRAKELVEQRKIPHLYWINKDQRDSPCIMHIEGTQNAIYCSRTHGTMIASGARHGQLSVFNLLNGDLIYTIPAHRYAINDLVWLDDMTILTASDDETVSKWNISTGVCLATYNGDAGAAQSLCLIPANEKHGPLVLACFSNTTATFSPVSRASGKGSVVVLDANTFKPISTHIAQQYAPVCVEYDPNSNLVAIDEFSTGYSPSCVSICAWDDSAMSLIHLQTIETANRQGSLRSRERDARLHSLAFSPCGSFLYAAVANYIVRYKRTSAAVADVVAHVQESSSGDRNGSNENESSTDDGVIGAETIFAMDATSSKDVHLASVFCVRFAEGFGLLSCGADKQVVVWEPSLETAKFCLIGHAWKVFCVDSARVQSTATAAIGHNDGDGGGDGSVRNLIVSCAGIWCKRIMVWEPTDAHVYDASDPSFRPPHFGEIVMGGSFSADHQFYVSSGQNGNASVQVWDAATGDNLSCISGRNASDGTFPGSIGCLPAILPTGDVAVASRRGDLAVFSPSDATRLPQPQDAPFLASALPDNANLVRDRSATEWVPSDGTAIGRMLRTKRCGGDIVLLPGGGYVVSCSENTTLFSVQDPDGEEPIELQGGSGRVVAVSPSGMTAVVVAQAQAQVWLLRPKRLITQIKSRNTALYGAAYSPNGRYIALADRSNFVNVYDARTYQPIAQFRMWDRAYRCVFTTDSQHIVCGGDDKTIGIWHVLTGEQVARCYVGAGVGEVSIGAARRLVAGDDLGRVCFYELRNFKFDLPVVTPTFVFDGERWSHEPLVTCPYTGHLFPLPEACKHAIPACPPQQDPANTVPLEAFLSQDLCIRSPFVTSSSTSGTDGRAESEAARDNDGYMRVNPFVADMRTLMFSPLDVAEEVFAGVPERLKKGALALVMMKEGKDSSGCHWVQPQDVLLTKEGALTWEMVESGAVKVGSIVAAQHPYHAIKNVGTIKDFDKDADMVTIVCEDGETIEQELGLVIHLVHPTSTTAPFTECWASYENYVHGKRGDFRNLFRAQYIKFYDPHATGDKNEETASLPVKSASHSDGKSSEQAPDEEEPQSVVTANKNPASPAVEAVEEASSAKEQQREASSEREEAEEAEEAEEEEEEEEEEEAEEEEEGQIMTKADTLSAQHVAVVAEEPDRPEPRNHHQQQTRCCTLL